MNPKRKAIGANPTVLTVFAVAVVAAMSFAAIATMTAGSTSMDTMTATVSTSISTSGQIQVLYVTGPVPPYNPGGPVVSVALKNAGGTAVTSLNATLAITAGTNSGAVHSPYWFFFDASSANPLLPGQSIQLDETLLDAGLQTGTNYPLTIYGVTADGTAFSYTVQIQVQAPPSASTA
jgi:hypothetical protein